MEMKSQAVLSPVSPTRLQIATFWAITAAVASTLISIAASQILLASALIMSGVLWRRSKGGLLPGPSLAIPLLLFVTWTLIAAMEASQTMRGLTEARKCFLYSIIFLAPFLAVPGRNLLEIYRTIFAVAGLAAFAGLIQFALHPSLDLQHRISGFMSHWMTYSGLLMLVLVALAAYAVCQGRTRPEWWVIPLALMLGTGMYLSETRNAWLGSIAGLTTVFALKRPRLVIVFSGLVAVLYLLSPAAIHQRLHSGWDQNDPETKGRLELAGTALRLIKDNPWLGVGPKNVNREALRYRGSREYPDWLYQHMHNNFLQITAERGIPGLVLWLWWMAQLAWDARKVLLSQKHNAEASLSATAALGSMAALLTAGMFEYNFGDSEVLTLFLFLVAAPRVFFSRASQKSDPDFSALEQDK
jgi:putative inorganic carbon (hco3(-)) transporter